MKRVGVLRRSSVFEESKDSLRRARDLRRARLFEKSKGFGKRAGFFEKSRVFLPGVPFLRRATLLRSLCFLRMVNVCNKSLSIDVSMFVTRIYFSVFEES